MSLPAHLFAVATLALTAFTAPAALAQGSAANSAAEQVNDAALAAWRAGRREEARRGFERACNLGSTEGCASVANMMHRGHGGPVDLPGARTRHAKACDGDHAESCFTLGIWLKNGDGGPADTVQAKVTFEKACKLGQQLACKLGAEL